MLFTAGSDVNRILSRYKNDLDALKRATDLQKDYIAEDFQIFGRGDVAYVDFMPCALLRYDDKQAKQVAQSLLDEIAKLIPSSFTIMEKSLTSSLAAPVIGVAFTIRYDSKSVAE